ncbi:ankyrin repeat-containing domain protein [Mycena vulgaris]|nr:ankyrin repeat-containing domain protein [Mycena vulgaris]
MPDRFKKWVRGLRPESRPSSRASASVPISNLPQPEPPSASETPGVDPGPIATSAASATIDNLTVALGLVQQVVNIVQKVPFIAPAAALMAELLKVYKEIKDADEKRDVLLSNITELTHDLCGTILRMEATNQVELIGRLKMDIETYAALLARGSRFIKQYNTQGVAKHVAARNELGSEMSALNRELELFGARFRTNRLVDLALNQSVNARTLDRVHDMVLKEKLEEWLACPDMRQKQLKTLELRHEGTGHWLLESDEFIQWQDNPGSLWIRGPSGAGKSVLSSTVISELVDDKQGFKGLMNSRPPPAIAFFYFDFKNRQSQAVDSALRRIILQLSAQSPNPYRALEEQYKSKSNGQTLPTYQELQTILESLLMELGRTYIVLDVLDECQEGDQRRLVDFVSALRKWTRTPLHLLLTSQPRRIFTEAFGDVTCIELESDLTQEDIRLFVESELQRLEPWAQCTADLVVSKSNGMFRMAACLIVEIFHCPWEDELEKTLENLPEDLFGIYDRFMQAIRPEHLLYTQAALRWLVFSQEELSPDELADTVAFDFSDPTHYIYKPSRREGNTITIPRWLEGLATFTGYSVVLAHSSVRDYLMSTRFTDEFGYNFSAGLSHTFIAQTCIGYFLYFSDHSLGKEGLLGYPLAQYVATHWCHHLLHSHDRTMLFGGAMRLLEDGTELYKVLKQAVWNPHASPLHLCCEEGYIEGVRKLLETGANVNLPSQKGSPLQVASSQGHTDLVHLLLENGADVNATSGPFEETALQAASWRGHKKIVHLLLENGADVHASGGAALQAASRHGRTKIVRLLFEKGADVNTGGGYNGSALQAASWYGHTETVQLLLENGADVNVVGGRYGGPLQAASRYGHADIVRLLLENGADVNATGEDNETALQAAAGGGHIEIVCLLLENGADVSGDHGTPLQAAAGGGHIEIARLLLENGADVNAISGDHGAPLQAAAGIGHIEIVRLLLENGADVNTSGGGDGSALQAAARSDTIEIARLLLDNEADVNAVGEYYGSALQAASGEGHTEIVRLLLENGADVDTSGGTYGSALQAAFRNGHTDIVYTLLERGAVDTRLEESDSDTEPVEEFD